MTYRGDWGPSPWGFGVHWPAPLWTGGRTPYEYAASFGPAGVLTGVGSFGTIGTPDYDEGIIYTVFSPFDQPEGYGVSQTIAAYWDRDVAGGSTPFPVIACRVEGQIALTIRGGHFSGYRTVHFKQFFYGQTVPIWIDPVGDNGNPGNPGRPEIHSDPPEVGLYYQLLPYDSSGPLQWVNFDFTLTSFTYDKQLQWGVLIEDPWGEMLGWGVVSGGIFLPNWGGMGLAFRNIVMTPTYADNEAACIADSFVRADSSGGFGTGSGGYPWINTGLSPQGIVSDQGYIDTTVGNKGSAELPIPLPGLPISAILTVADWIGPGNPEILLSMDYVDAADRPGKILMGSSAVTPGKWGVKVTDADGNVTESEATPGTPTYPSTFVFNFSDSSGFAIYGTVGDQGASYSGGTPHPVSPVLYVSNFQIHVSSPSGPGRLLIDSLSICGLNFGPLGSCIFSVASGIGRISTQQTAGGQYGTGRTTISLVSPTELGDTTRHMTWRIRLSDVMTDPIGADYVSFGGDIDTWGWMIKMLGGGLATFELVGTNSPTSEAFTPTALQWYIVETEFAPGTFKARIYLDGATPGAWLSDSTSGGSGLPQTADLFLNAGFATRPAQFYIEYDWIKVVSARPITAISSDCEVGLTTDRINYPTTYDFVLNSTIVTLNGLRQRLGIDYIEHPVNHADPPDGRSHYISFTSTVDRADAVQICYVKTS